MQTLVFVYNANDGFVQGIIDLLHKNISPRTYPCSLCAITYTNAGMRPLWKEFISGLPVEVKFLHKNEWQHMFPKNNDALPAAFWITPEGPRLCITAEEMQAQNSLEGLMMLTMLTVKSKMQN
ncbi:MAG: hypothetical protein R2794_09205 [Chitinophagales bacterium]